MSARPRLRLGRAVVGSPGSVASAPETERSLPVADSRSIDKRDEARLGRTPRHVLDMIRQAAILVADQDGGEGPLAPRLGEVADEVEAGAGEFRVPRFDRRVVRRNVDARRRGERCRGRRGVGRREDRCGCDGARSVPVLAVASPRPLPWPRPLQARLRPGRWLLRSRRWWQREGPRLLPGAPPVAAGTGAQAARKVLAAAALPNTAARYFSAWRRVSAPSW